MVWSLARKAAETVDLSHLLTGVTGAAWLTRSGKIRVMRLVDVVPTTIASGASFLVLDAHDRPAMRIDDSWWETPTSTGRRTGFVTPFGAVGVWAPSASDQYRQTITWGVK